MTRPRRKRRRHFNDCGDKIRYATPAEAVAQQPAQQPYLCQRCGCWHLTSHGVRAS